MSPTLYTWLCVFLFIIGAFIVVLGLLHFNQWLRDRHYRKLREQCQNKQADINEQFVDIEQEP